MTTRATRFRLLALLGVTALSAAVVFSQPPIPQDPAYHRFADTRAFLGVPNFLNVVSNLPFLVIGGVGLLRLRRRLVEPAGAAEMSETAAWLLLFLGIFLTGFGSAWYHLRPDNASLVWDRLPMTLGFMGFFAGIVGERLGRHAYRLLLWPLLGIGVSSVLFWYAGELRGAGDLRLYALVQFFPLLLIPLLMAFYRPRYTGGVWVFLALAAYGSAKAFEMWDHEIYRALGGTVSGHPLKHLAAAVGCWALLHMFSRRRRVAA
ncbi:MAG TPA: alkaline phytoceramidase [Acidobacteria bacterium]|nr:alkaline phytoceramidase [Acidobacteriota bacterium]